jgi:aminopeptidase N
MRKGSIKYTMLLTFIMFCNVVSAQLLDGMPASFSHSDSLRGGLRPERTCYDVNFYDLNINLNVADKSISGYNTMYFTANKKFDSLQIDLFENMVIDKIEHNEIPLIYRRDGNAIFVTMDKSILPKSKDKIRIVYHGAPIKAKRAPWDGGFVWAKDNDGKDWIAVACEGTGASLWWPCKDELSDEPDSMKITCTIPSDLQFVGNGIMLTDTKNIDSTRTTTWKVSYPINNYNVTLNIGNYVHFSDTYHSPEMTTDLALDYYVMPYNLEKAKKQFTQVKPMMACYEKYFGAYPFWNDGYALVETPYLGMEHQGAIAYGNKYKIGYDGRDFSGIGLDFDYIIIHESGHEWWGNSVSCKDLADLWIHEGFCTYSESVYVEELYGKKKAQDYIHAKQKGVANKEPIQGKYGVNNEGAGDMYNKSCLFLNTLRTVVNNDSLWFGMIHDFASKTFKLKNIDYNDVVRYFESRSRKSLRPLFEQYLKHTEIPTLIYKIEDKNKFMKTIYYKWKADVPSFQMRFYYDLNGKKDYAMASTNWSSFDVRVRKVKKFVINQEKMYINIQKI